MGITEIKLFRSALSFFVSFHPARQDFPSKIQRLPENRELPCRRVRRGVSFPSMKRMTPVFLTSLLLSSLFFSSLLVPASDAEAAWPMYSKSTNAKRFRKIPAVSPEPGVKELANSKNGVRRTRNEVISEAERKRRYDYAMRYGARGYRSQRNPEFDLPNYGQGW